MFCITCKKEKEVLFFLRKRRRISQPSLVLLQNICQSIVESKHVEISNTSSKGRSRTCHNQNNDRVLPFANLFMLSFIHASTHSPTNPSTHPSIHPPIRPPTHPPQTEAHSVLPALQLICVSASCTWPVTSFLASISLPSYC